MVGNDQFLHRSKVVKLQQSHAVVNPQCMREGYGSRSVCVRVSSVMCILWTLLKTFVWEICHHLPATVIGD